MAGPAPKTRHWSARENAHKPKGLHVIVCGQVEVNSTNMEPHLEESPERNPKHLGLHLSIAKTAAEGADVKVWKSASFHKEVKANEYDSVTVRWDVNSIAQFPVVDDREHATELAALTASANAKVGKKPAAKKPAAKKTAPKKPAKKAAASKKKTPKAVGGWAKGKKAKKPAKKAAKAKKVAKKSKKPAKKAARKAKKR